MQDIEKALENEITSSDKEIDKLLFMGIMNNNQKISEISSKIDKFVLPIVIGTATMAITTIGIFVSVVL